MLKSPIIFSKSTLFVLVRGGSLGYLCHTLHWNYPLIGITHSASGLSEKQQIRTFRMYSFFLTLFRLLLSSWLVNIKSNKLLSYIGPRVNKSIRLCVPWVLPLVYWSCWSNNRQPKLLWRIWWICPVTYLRLSMEVSIIGLKLH